MIVFCYGRFQGFHQGHALVIQRTVVECMNRWFNNEDVNFNVVFSHVQDSKDNPLTLEQKIKHAQHFWPRMNNCFIGTTTQKPSFLDVATIFNDVEKNTLVMVAGGDRVAEFQTKLDKYNGKLYNYKKIEVVSAGDRNSKHGIEGMTGTKMREFVRDNRFNQFIRWLPEHATMAHAKELFEDMREGLGFDRN